MEETRIFQDGEVAKRALHKLMLHYLRHVTWKNQYDVTITWMSSYKMTIYTAHKKFTNTAKSVVSIKFESRYLENQMTSTVQFLYIL